MRQKEKREDILKAATEVFCTKGFYSANIIDIAQKAGIGKGTVYEYFKSKSFLFLEMMRYNSDNYTNKLKGVISNNVSFYDKLNSFISCHNDIIIKNMKTAVMFMKLPVDFTITAEDRKEVYDIICNSRNRVSSLLADILHLGQKEKIIIDTDLSFLSDIFLEMIARFSIRCALMELSKEQIKIQSAVLIDLFLNGAGTNIAINS